MQRGIQVIVASLALSWCLVSPSPAGSTAPPVETGDTSSTSRMVRGDRVVVAHWKMRETNRASRMRDASRFRQHGKVRRHARKQGLRRNGDHYRWSRRCPSCLPVAPARVVRVPDSSRLDIPDPSVRWAARIRYRTPRAGGNIMQKGQARSPGGQFKLEHTDGRATCVWIGANGDYFALRSPVRTDDNRWHVVRCVHREASLALWLDGVRRVSRDARTGPIDNEMPFVVGGKSRCDNVGVSCDYYTGRIDFIRITRG